MGICSTDGINVMKKNVVVGLVGMGVVGSGVARVIYEKSTQLENLVGKPILLKKILVKDKSKPRSFTVPSNIFVDNINDIIDDPEVDVVVELVGGDIPAFSFIMSAIDKGKHVVTANKEVIAKHGTEIFTAARKNGVRVLFEASVGGGIPVISPLMRDLVANDTETITAIINGTTNYILTKMANENVDYQTALQGAMDLGYAESDPTNDVEGIDAAYKLAILSTLSFRTQISDDDVFREGITKLSPSDFKYARELGYEIKLLAISTLNGGLVQARVHPSLIPADRMLANVNGVSNAIEIETDLTDKVIFHGPGAGSGPTSSAVVADLVNIGRNVVHKVPFLDPVTISNKFGVSKINELESKYYLRMEAEDRPGVLAQIGSVLADHEISISSFIQKGSDHVTSTVELIIMTHLAKEERLRQTLESLSSLRPIKNVCNVIRVTD